MSGFAMYNTSVPASAHFPVGYNCLMDFNRYVDVPASAHFPVGYNVRRYVYLRGLVPASAHFPVGYNDFGADGL